MTRWLSSLIVVLALGACSGAGRPSRPLPPGEQFVVLAAELERSGQTNLYDAIKRIRPFWFTRDTRNLPQGEGSIAVYLDDQQIGGTGALRRLPISTTAIVRYIFPAEAQLRFGQINGLRAAIAVESARP